jgi:hypothetical protein
MNYGMVEGQRELTDVVHEVVAARWPGVAEENIVSDSYPDNDILYAHGKPMFFQLLINDQDHVGVAVDPDGNVRIIDDLDAVMDEVDRIATEIAPDLSMGEIMSILTRD